MISLNGCDGLCAGWHCSENWLYRVAARGPRKRLKRLSAPCLGNDQAPRPSPGPHKLREFLPLTIFPRNRLKYALTGREVTSIVKQRLIKIDGKVCTDTTYPAGFMGAFTSFVWWKKSILIFIFSDVITIEKSGEHFWLLYDVKGRFTIHRITPEEASYKLLKVRRVAIGNGEVPHIVTHDGQMDAQFFTLILILKPTIPSNMISIRQDQNFSGEGIKPWISLPKGKGIKLTISEERDVKRKRAAKQ